MLKLNIFEGLPVRKNIIKISKYNFIYTKNLNKIGNFKGKLKRIGSH